MNTAFAKKIRRIWGLGLVMFALHLYQNTYDFEPKLGIHFLSIPGAALAVLVVAAGILSFFLSRKESAERPRFIEHFASPVKSTFVMVSAALLFAAGGAMLITRSIATGAGIAPLVTGGFAIASALGFLLLIKLLRNQSAFSVAPVLPVMFFAAFWVLTLYLPAANDPILARYYLPILAAAMSAYAFAQLAGFFRGESRVRSFNFTAEYAATLCIAAIADFDRHSLLFAACAVMLTVFLALQGRSNAAEDQDKSPIES